MENAYWVGRIKASLKSAQEATSAEARLIHYELAGRYSLNALAVDTQAIAQADALPFPICTGGGKAAALKGDRR